MMTDPADNYRYGAHHDETRPKNAELMLRHSAMVAFFRAQ